MLRELFILKNNTNRYYTGIRAESRQYNYGWDYNPEEACLFDSIDDIKNLINKCLEDKYSYSFSKGDYKVERILRIEETEY